MSLKSGGGQSRKSHATGTSRFMKDLLIDVFDTFDGI
jgi:hypothetical protein